MYNLLILALTLYINDFRAKHGRSSLSAEFVHGIFVQYRYHNNKVTAIKAIRDLTAPDADVDNMHDLYALLKDVDEDTSSIIRSYYIKARGKQTTSLLVAKTWFDLVVKATS